MPDERKPADERHWWEMQLGMKLRGGRRAHPSTPEGPPAEPPEKPVHRSFVLTRPSDEHRWWEMQLGKKVKRTRN